MVRVPIVLRLTAKAAGWLLSALVILVFSWFAANRLLDEPVAPERAAMLKPSSPVADRQNAAVGMLGLTAPKDTDFIEYGVQLRALHARNASHEQIQQMLHGPKTLRPTVENSQVTCWLDPDWTFIDGCLPFDRAPAVLHENKELLERYKKLYEFEHHAAINVYYNDAYLLATKLAVAESHLDIRRGDYESAYRNWYRQLRFARSNLRGTDTWVGKAIGLVALGMPIPVLERLLLASPDIAKAHSEELYELLRPEGSEAFDPDGVVRGELWLFTTALDRAPVSLPDYGIDRVHWLAFYLGQKNRILNRYAAFAPDYAASLRLPWTEMERESARLREKYLYPSRKELLLDPFGSLFLAQFIDSELKAREMLRQMHITDGRFRLATLLVRIVKEDIRDSDIPTFLASVDPAFRDPFSGIPPRWDPKDRKIYFVDPMEKCMVTSWFRVPDRKGARKTPSVVDTNAC